MNETRDLLLRWHQGDSAALAALVEEHTPFIERLVRQRLGQQLRQRFDTQDIVQTTLLEVLKDGPRFVVSDRAHLRALLGRMVENVLRGKADHARAAKRDVRRDAQAPAGETILYLDAQPGSGPTPSQAASADETRAWVRLALEMLDPDDRNVVLWREYQDLPFAEIAARLQVGEDAARMRFNRALPKLAKKLEQLKRGGLSDLLPGGP